MQVHTYKLVLVELTHDYTVYRLIANAMYIDWYTIFICTLSHDRSLLCMNCLYSIDVAHENIHALSPGLWGPFVQ